MSEQQEENSPKVHLESSQLPITADRTKDVSNICAHTAAAKMQAARTLCEEKASVVRFWVIDTS